jgi:hypothetical protein
MSTVAAIAPLEDIGDVEDIGFVGRGDFTKERHEWPKRSLDEIYADMACLEAEHPERLTIEPMRLGL